MWQCLIEAIANQFQYPPTVKVEAVFLRDDGVRLLQGYMETCFSPTFVCQVPK